MTGLLARHVDSAEAERIFARVARHERARPEIGGAVSVADLMEAAMEAGLDPDEVRRAAAIERVPSPDRFGGALFGTGTRHEVRAHLPDARLPDHVGSLERAAEAGLGHGGTLREGKGGRFVWGEDHALGRSTVAVEQREGGVDVRVSSDRTGLFTLTWFLGTFALSVVTALIGLQARIGLVLTIALIALLPPILARPFWRRTDREIVTTLEDTAMDLLRAVDRPDGTEPLESGTRDQERLGSSPEHEPGA